MKVGLGRAGTIARVGMTSGKRTIKPLPFSCLSLSSPPSILSFFSPPLYLLASFSWASFSFHSISLLHFSFIPSLISSLRSLLSSIHYSPSFFFLELAYCPGFFLLSLSLLLSLPPFILSTSPSCRTSLETLIHHSGFVFFCSCSVPPPLSSHATHLNSTHPTSLPPYLCPAPSLSAPFHSTAAELVYGYR